MQLNFTQKNWRSSLLMSPVLFVMFCLFAGKTNAQCTWSASTAYPIPILDQASVTHGANLYSFAGVTAGALTANSYSFNGTAWTPIAPTPQPLEFPAAVSDGTNIYIMGGASTTGTSLNVLYRYNVATNTYTTLAPMATGVWNHAAVFHNGFIYKIGGSGPTATNVVERYNIATNTWTTMAPYPINVSFPSAVVIGNFIYSAGGISGSGTAKAYRYDPATNTWDDAAMADLPQTRWGSASSVYNGGFIMAGGYVNGDLGTNVSASVVQYDVATNSWVNLPNMLQARSRMTGAIAAGAFYVVGGRTTAGGFAGTTDNQRLNCIALTPCTGTPNPGQTQSSATTVCPTIPFTLSLANQTPGSGVTYQWQSGPSATGPWTNIGTPSANNQLVTTQTATTYYQAIVTCGANSGTSIPVVVNLTPPSGCYCAAGATSTAFEKISNVTFGTINNNSTSTAGYENFTNLSTTVIKGQTLPISVTISGPFSSDQVIVWIDFNQNGNFSDPGEEVYRSPRGTGPHVGNITISPNALTGPTRMRVRMHDAALGPNNTPCGNSTYGQVEDYTVDIQPCVNVTITSPPANTTVQCSANATFTVGATGSALIYAWEYRQTPTSPWQMATNTPPFSGATTNTLTVTNVGTNFNGYQFRALVSNPCTGIDFTSTATLTVAPLVAAVTPASATICTGSIQQLSLTNAAFPTTTTFTNPVGLPILIPDNNVTGINHTIPVTLPAGSVISNIRVRFSIPAHTWPGDLVIALRAPNGQVLNLSYGISGTGAGPGAGMVNTTITSDNTAPLLSSGSAPYSGTYRADARTVPAASMGNAPVAPAGYTATIQGTWAPFLTSPTGNWTLAIYDAFAGDVGSLTAWSIEITYGAAAQGVWSASPATPNTMFTDPAATIPYVPGSLANTIYVRPTVNTNYSVVYSTTTPCVSGPTVIPVTVINPTGAVTQPVATAACVGTSATFTVAAAGGPNTFQWQVSSDGGLTWTNITGATGSTLTVPNVTSSMNNFRYRAVITAAPCAGTVTSSAATLTVNNLPTVSLTTSDPSLTPGQSTTITATSTPAAGPNGFVWTLNGNPIPGTSASQVVRIDGLGVYRARVTDINGCVRETGDLTISAEASDRLWIYPNPSPGTFQVRLFYGGTVAEDRRVNIYNSAGQLIMEKDFDLNSTTSPYLRMDFDMSKFADGTYVVNVRNRHTGQIASGLVVIQRD